MYFAIFVSIFKALRVILILVSRIDLAIGKVGGDDHDHP
jgi:hypothetical protein